MTLMKENSNGKKNTYDINEREQQWKKNTYDINEREQQWKKNHDIQT